MRNLSLSAAALIFILSAAIVSVSAGEVTSSSQKTEPVREVPVTIDNRQIAVFRSSFQGFNAEERAAKAVERIRALPAGSETGEFAVEPAQIGNRQARAITINGRVMFFLTDADISAQSGETLDSAGQRAVQAMRSALQARVAEAGFWSGVVLGSAEIVIATLSLIILLWLLRHARRWIENRLAAFAALPEKYLKLSAVDLHAHFVQAGRGLARIVFVVIAAFSTYLWLVYCLERFPYTYRWGAQLGDFLTALALQFATGALTAIPGVVTVIIIILIARWCAGLINTFFNEVRSRKITLPWIAHETARTTQTLLVVAIWVFALVVAYPYIPGSNTEAFRGLSVLIGLMVTLGSTGLINQVISGLFVTYARTVRPEDYVRVGDIEGEVIDVGLLATKLKTPRQEEITIPHSVLVGTATTNYSRLAGEQGMVVTVSVTIGYDAPWRQVHALLLLGATRTPGIRKEPAPRVMQRELSDFYVQYQLLAHLDDEKNRAAVLSELHAQIQDAFNQYGMQIMSPHFKAQPEKPVFVPQTDWYAPPAQPPVTPSGATEQEATGVKNALLKESS